MSMRILIKIKMKIKPIECIYVIKMYLGENQIKVVFA